MSCCPPSLETTFWGYSTDTYGKIKPKPMRHICEMRWRRSNASRNRLIFFVESIDAISDPAGKYALSVVNACLNKRTISLVPSLAAHSVACAEAAKRLRRDSASSGFREGQAWRLMIRKLLNIAKKSNLPCTVAKPNTRQKTEFRPSPFVKFVKALQDRLPEMHWPPPRTVGALAVAISSVRSDRAKCRSHLPEGAGGE